MAQDQKTDLTMNEIHHILQPALTEISKRAGADQHWIDLRVLFRSAGDGKTMFFDCAGRANVLSNAAEDGS